MLTRPAPLGPRDEPDSAGIGALLSGLMAVLRGAFTPSTPDARPSQLPAPERLDDMSARAKRMMRSRD
jgi:hypothetical protein